MDTMNEATAKAKADLDEFLRELPTIRENPGAWVEGWLETGDHYGERVEDFGSVWSKTTARPYGELGIEVAIHSDQPGIIYVDPGQSYTYREGDLSVGIKLTAIIHDLAIWEAMNEAVGY